MLKLKKTNVFGLLLWCLVFSAHGTTVYGHRGARGLAPENTLPAYKIALDYKVDAVDLDVVMTKDGILVVYHDLTLNPDLTRDAEGHWIKNSNIAIKNLTLQQLKTYDVGRIKPHTRYAALFKSQQPRDKTPIPTLQEVIQYVKKTAGDRVGFQIEVKTDPTQPYISASPRAMVVALEKIIRNEHIVQRTKVQAYDWRCLLALQNINPNIATAYITDVQQEHIMHAKNPALAGQWSAGYLLKNYHDSIPRMIKALGGQYWDAQDVEITAERLKEAHQLGLKVDAWSLPEHTGKDIDIKLTKRLIAMPVDGIITDRPDIVMALIKSEDQKKAS